MGCGSCGSRYKGYTGQAQRLKNLRRRRVVIKGGKKVVENVIDTPLVNKSDTVTAPATGATIPATGMALSIQQTGMDPTNMIAQRLPEAVNPVIVDANKGAAGTSNATESAVIPTPGGN